jgi:hypothetical protein
MISQYIYNSIILIELSSLKMKLSICISPGKPLHNSKNYAHKTIVGFKIQIFEIIHL